MKHLLKISDMTAAEMSGLIDEAIKMKAQAKKGVYEPLLAGKTLGMIFSKSSTRTRVSFEVGMYQLGGHALFLSSNDIQLGRGEPVSDTAAVLSRYVDGIMIRTFAQQDVEDLAKYGTVPVINGLTDLEHPCQILADLMTVCEHKGALKGLKMAYVGDGNNIANSLAAGCAKAGMDFAVATPKGYECDAATLAAARAEAAANGSAFLVTNDPAEAVAGADAVYTDTWVSMGQEADKERKIKDFAGFAVDAALFGKAKQDAIFLHCLPAYRGYEVAAEVIDGPRSAVFDEAENRLHAQKAVMAALMGRS